MGPAPLLDPGDLALRLALRALAEVTLAPSRAKGEAVIAFYAPRIEALVAQAHDQGAAAALLLDQEARHVLR